MSGGREPVKWLRKAEASETSFLEEMATPLPDKKLVSKTTGKEASLLQQSLTELHREFCSSRTRISFSTFAKCRARNIRYCGKIILCRIHNHLDALEEAAVLANTGNNRKYAIENIRNMGNYRHYKHPSVVVCKRRTYHCEKT